MHILSYERIHNLFNEERNEEALVEIEKEDNLTLDLLLLKFDIIKKLAKNDLTQKKLGNISLDIAHHYHFILNEFNKGGKHAIIAKNIFSELRDKLGFARSLYYEGAYNLYTGKLENAEELFKECIEVYNQTELPRQADRSIGSVSGAFQALGQLSLERGELDEALGIFNQDLDSFNSQLKEAGENMTLMHGRLAFKLSFISLIYRAKFDYNKAISTSRSAMLHLQQETQRLPVFYYGHCFFSHFLILLDLNQIDQAKEFLVQTKLKLESIETTKVIVQGLNLCNALLLHQSQNLRSKFQAMEIFEQIINGEVIYKTF